MRADDRRAAGHVVLHLLHASAGLMEMPPVSNVMPLPTSPSTGVRRRARRARSGPRSGAAAPRCRARRRAAGPCRAAAICVSSSTSTVTPLPAQTCGHSLGEHALASGRSTVRSPAYARRWSLRPGSVRDRPPAGPRRSGPAPAESRSVTASSVPSSPVCSCEARSQRGEQRALDDACTTRSGCRSRRRVSDIGPPQAASERAGHDVDAP